MKQRYFSTFMLLLLSASFLTAQKTESAHREVELTLQEAITIAQEQSPNAIAARHSMRASHWNYRFYKANYLPSVTLNSSPNYNRSISKVTLADGTQNYVHQNILTTDLAVTIQQNLALTGGNFTLVTTAERLDIIDGDKKSYSTQPVLIGYQQALFGYNSLKWDKKIEPIVYKEACKNYNETMELVASQACNYFFNLATAQTNLDIASFNHASADTLYTYAQGRYNIGTITENEMLQLEINKLNEEANQMSAHMEVDNKMQSLRSYLGFHDDVIIRVKIEDSIPELTVSLDQALILAYENNPDPETFIRQRLQSESSLAYAKANAGLKASIYLQFGLSQTGESLGDAYKDPANKQYASINLSVPILDWGRSKGKVKVARSNHDLTQVQIEQRERDFDLNVRKMVKQFNLQARRMTIAAKTDQTAERRFEVARKLYIMGKSTILDLNSAIAEKDAARRNYISTLSTYWSLFYTLRSLTGYDFVTDREIKYETDF